MEGFHPHTLLLFSRKIKNEIRYSSKRFPTLKNWAYDLDWSFTPSYHDYYNAIFKIIRAATSSEQPVTPTLSHEQNRAIPP